MAERNELTPRTEFGESFRERSVDEIRQDIAARRETITETVDKLSEQVQRKLDWREYVANHPFAALGIAAGTGILVAGIFKQRSTPGERIMCALSDSVEDLTSRLSNELDFVLTKRPSAGSALMIAATSIIAKTMTEYLGTRLSEPGTPQPYTNPQDAIQTEREQIYARGTST